MKVLHILRAEPDDMVTALMAGYEGHEAKAVAVYEEDIDWEALVDDIFCHEHVVCWW